MFGAQEDASPEEVQKGIRKAQSPIILSVDADQLPLLPDETPTNRLDMAAIIRQFVMGYYSESDGGPISHCADTLFQDMHVGMPKRQSPGPP